MRALITGAHGQLGRELVYLLTAMKNEAGSAPSAWLNAEVDAVDRDELDISSEIAVDTWFSRHDPYDVVFNCAAYTNVDGCEINEQDAYAVNASGPENLSRACSRTGAVLVHVSTDYVFSGKKPGMRQEDDLCEPVSAYGRTKLAGEQAALALNPRAHVVRTAWLYGHEGKNFAHTMMRLGVENESVTVVCDQIGNPTNAADLAREMLRIALSDSYGIWHATCEGECSWADFAQAIMVESGLNCEVRRCTSEQWKAEHPASADRPAYSSLENGHLARTIGSEMRPWREALASFIAGERALNSKRERERHD